MNATQEQHEWMQEVLADAIASMRNAGREPSDIVVMLADAVVAYALMFGGERTVRATVKRMMDNLDEWQEGKWP